jgi:hypothetical protein
VVGGHAPGFGAAEFCENGADAYVLYFRRVEVGELGDCGFEDLEVLGLSSVWNGGCRTYGSEQLMVVRVSQTALLCSCDRRSKRGEENDIVWVLLEDVLEALL